jgi:lysophospholipase L1-like esterase
MRRASSLIGCSARIRTGALLNRGVNGERSDEIAARFDRDVLAHRPRVVVIIAGVNDVYQGQGE